MACSAGARWKRYEEVCPVIDNGLLMQMLLGAAAHQRAERQRLDIAWQLLEELELAAMAERPAGTLAYGNRRRLEMARALATRPQLLLLDEPAAGLNPAEKDQLSVLIIEHHIPLLMRLCDRLAVFDFGVRIALGTPEAIRRDPKWHRSHRAPGRARDPAGLQRRR